VKTNNPKQVIPIEFGKTHLQRMVGRNVTLFVDKDRTWNVDLKLISNKQFTLSGGWSKFRAHYNLKFGDVCVFLLNKCKETVSFQVVIFSLEKDMTTPYFEGNYFIYLPLYIHEGIFILITNYTHELFMLVQGIVKKCDLKACI
jgi:hypothetical protein